MTSEWETDWLYTQEEWSRNPDDPSADQFSILDQLERLAREEGPRDCGGRGGGDPRKPERPEMTRDDPRKTRDDPR